MGSQVAQALSSKLQVTSCGQLAALLDRNAGALQQLGLPQARAALLAAFCRGVDTSPVVDKGPPQSFQVLSRSAQPQSTAAVTATSSIHAGTLAFPFVTANHCATNCYTPPSCCAAAFTVGMQLRLALLTTPHYTMMHIRSHAVQVQMTLTPVPIPAPRSIAAVGTADGSVSANGPVMLQPLPVRGPDTMPRVTRLLQHMCRDLAARVVLDRCGCGCLSPFASISPFRRHRFVWVLAWQLLA